MNLELWQILGNQAFDDAFYADMHGRMKIGDMWDDFVKSEIRKYKMTGILPNYITYATATSVSPPLETGSARNGVNMP